MTKYCTKQLSTHEYHHASVSGRQELHFEAERNEVGMASWSHVRVVVVGDPHGGPPASLGEGSAQKGGQPKGDQPKWGSACRKEVSSEGAQPSSLDGDVNLEGGQLRGGSPVEGVWHYIVTCQ